MNGVSPFHCNAPKVTDRPTREYRSQMEFAEPAAGRRPGTDPSHGPRVPVSLCLMDHAHPGWCPVPVSDMPDAVGANPSLIGFVKWPPNARDGDRGGWAAVRRAVRGVPRPERKSPRPGGTGEYASHDVPSTYEPAPDRPHGPGVVVVGASAGGVEALVALVRSLPADFPHPMLIVLHVSPTGTSVLPAILARACRLPVGSPEDGDGLLSGHVYVAPPDCHLVVEESCMRLSQAPRENGHRPAIDPTMRTAANVYDGATIGIVLSGSRDDGTAGLMAIKARGGTAIVQDPDEAMYPAMPLSAIAHVEPDAVLRISAMAQWILDHSAETNGAPGRDPPMATDEPTERSRIAIVHTRADPRDSASGEGTRFTCPDCGGVLFEHHEGALERFQCSVGHVFSIESLSSAQGDALEGALWAAVRSLEDRSALLERLAGRADQNDLPRSSATFAAQADEALERARTIRETIERSADEQPIAAES